MLKETIRHDLNSALKEKKELELSVLRLISAAILNKEKEKRYKISKEKPDAKEADLEKESQLQDEEILDVIASEVKKRKESIELFEKGGRKDLAEKEAKEKEILQKYLPEQMSEEEIKKLVEAAVAQAGAKEIRDMGKVMAILTPQIKGKADMGQVSKIVKETLIR